MKNKWIKPEMKIVIINSGFAPPGAYEGSNYPPYFS